MKILPRSKTSAELRNARCLQNPKTQMGLRKEERQQNQEKLLDQAPLQVMEKTHQNERCLPNQRILLSPALLKEGDQQSQKTENLRLNAHRP